MSQVYTARRRTSQDHTQAAAPASQGRQAAPGLGADAQAFGMGSRLEELMQERMRQHFLDHQIPEAEREADRLASAAQGARTPEEVKTRMGERLGADFSGVRFHTDSGAFHTAEDMGARAYATGRDIYFGQGGFDPAVAAHELVHTVQQGAVTGEGVSVSAPAGQVQMKPEDPLLVIRQEILDAEREKKELKKEGRLAKKELRHAVRGGRSSVREAKRLAKSTDKMLAEDKKPGRLSRFASAVKGRVKRLFGRSSGGQELTPEEEAMLEAGLNGEDQDQLSPEDEALLEAGLNGEDQDQLSPEDEALLRGSAGGGAEGGRSGPAVSRGGGHAEDAERRPGGQGSGRPPAQRPQDPAAHRRPGPGGPEGQTGPEAHPGPMTAALPFTISRDCKGRLPPLPSSGAAGGFLRFPSNGRIMAPVDIP